MKFEIKCSTFTRLASICNFFEPTTEQELKDQINTVRLEKVNGKTIAIVTNQKIAAIEILPQYEPGENGHVAHIVLDPSLIAQCKAESFFDGSLYINTIPEIATGMAQTSSGWAFQGNACHWFTETIMDNWRDWANPIPSLQSYYVMAWNLAHVQALFESSPSGKIYFPRHIDASKSITLRDLENPNWVGLFMPKRPNNQIHEEPATLPEWWFK